MPGFTGFVAILFSFNCQRQDYKFIIFRLSMGNLLLLLPFFLLQQFFFRPDIIRF